MGPWYYYYKVSFIDLEEEVEDEGVVFAEDGTYAAAVDKVTEYYGDEELNEVYLKPIFDAACLPYRELLNHYTGEFK